MKRLRMRISTPEEKRGSFEGAIRIPLRALSFLFNDLAFLGIPRKSLKFLTLLFSIPTARTHQLALAIFSYNRNTFQRGPSLGGSLDSAIFLPTILIATPVT